MKHPQGLLVVATLFALSCYDYSLVHANPIGPPNLNECRSVSTLTNCCLPLPKKEVLKFSFQLYPLVKKVRPSVHTIGEGHIKKYKRAYELMRALPSDDPRSFAQQANLHCAMCLGAYYQPGTSAILHMHYSWMFFPWHRWYIYFHERILAKLIEDSTFALPFWDWDNQVTGNSLPTVYTDENSALYNPNRNPSNAPPSIIQLNGNFNETNTNVIVDGNLRTLYEQVVVPTKADVFMGGVFRLGDSYPSIDAQSEAIGGILDNGIHGIVHQWVGNPILPDHMDMGSFTFAARDPIFYSHHANVDRLWHIWQTSLPGGPRQVYNDSDFLNTSFIFYDENADLIEVTIKDCLDNEKLGTTYAKVPSDKLWINYSSSKP